MSSDLIKPSQHEPIRDIEQALHLVVEHLPSATSGRISRDDLVGRAMVAPTEGEPGRLADILGELRRAIDDLRRDRQP